MIKSPFILSSLLIATALFFFSPSIASDNFNLDEEDLENYRILVIIERNRALGYSDTSDKTLGEIRTYLATRNTSTSAAIPNTETKEFETK
ncbi:hypothetical protein IM40_03135 [Candidatus Paracaedimonas acanthamoebae]|nr:hypothetical protein IM40_03135 [Candidatus Paracaedimonas acanthamoebae]